MNLLHLLSFFGSGLVGLVILYLYLKNDKRTTQFKNVQSAFLLGVALVGVAAYVGMKANIIHWLTCVAYAGGAAYLTYELLQRKDKSTPEPMPLNKSLTPGKKTERNDILIGLRNCFVVLVMFAVIILLDYSSARWLLFLVTPTMTSIAGWFFTKNNSGIARWAVIGLLAGTGFYLAL